MNGQVPPQVQDKLNQFRSLQQQLQMLSIQKQQLNQQSTETEHALKELDNVKGKEKIYRAAGPLFIETTQKDSKKKLEEEKDNIEAKINVMEKQEKKVREKLNSLREEVQGILQGLQGGTEGGVVTGG